MLALLVLPGRAGALHIVFGAHNIPHPAKVSRGGEDAFFFDDRLGIFGIADGVGGSRTGDPGAFSREILRRCHTTASMPDGSGMPMMTEALRIASKAPIALGGSTTLLLGQLEAGTNNLRLLNLGDSGAMLLRPSLRSFGDDESYKVLFPRTVLRSHDQSHFFNCPYQANARNFEGVTEELDELSTPVREGDVVIAATDGVLDNLFDRELQACVSEHLHVLMGDDAGAAQQSISLLAKSIAERAAAIGLRKGDAGISTPFMQAAAEEGYDFRGGKLDDVALVCGVVRRGEPPGLRFVHNFNGEADGKIWLRPADASSRARGVVVPAAPTRHAQPHAAVA